MATLITEPMRENPLVPNSALRGLDATMRVLRSESSRQKAPSFCARGEEAIYASSLLSLCPGDVVSAATNRPKKLALESSPLWLPHSDLTALSRLSFALGAAALLRAQATKNLVLAYVAADALSRAQWQQLLGIAGQQALPIIFVAMNAKRRGELSRRAQSWGTPGIPVDASDAVALFRVLQESALRARHGDGPALVEPILWTLDGPAGDPLVTMRQLLRRRGLLSRTVPQPDVAQPDTQPGTAVGPYK